MRKVRYKFLVSPVLQAKRVKGFIAMALIANQAEDLSPYFLILQTSTGFFNYSNLVHEDPDQNRHALEKSSALVEIAEKACSLEDFDEACLNLVNELETYFSCYRTALGFKSVQGIQPSAVSHIIDFDPKSTSSLALQAAMREAEKLDTSVSIPPRDDDKQDPIQITAHQELKRILDLETVESLPLRRPDGSIFGVLVLMWDESHSRPQEHSQLIDATLPPLSGLLHLLYKARPNLLQKYVLQRWTGWSEKKRQILLYGAIALFVLLFLPSFPYKISTKCTLEPVTRRIVAAPFNCRLERALVEPGQPIKKGDVLAQLDGKEIRAQLAELIARRDRAAKMADQAMASDDVPSFQVAQLEMESLNYEIEILSERTRQLEIRSPISGIVIMGDLERAEGVPLEKGEPLFEVGPLGEVVAECAIPENDIAYVREKMPVRIKLNAFPGDKWLSQIQNINPRSETQNNRNVFVGEAYLDNTDLKLKPGMQGKAVIESEGRSLAWILFHKMWEFIQIKLLW
ncbi:MAG: efflux RND transporter periplasmic adaptor subunit [Verrucomicrobiota bacterium]